jgi:hypothetical protein
MFNRRLTQTIADSIFSLLDLSKENLHALRANRFYKRWFTRVADLNCMMSLYWHINFFNRAAIDVFFVPRVAGQKGLRSSRG